MLLKELCGCLLVSVRKFISEKRKEIINQVMKFGPGRERLRFEKFNQVFVDNVVFYFKMLFHELFKDFLKGKLVCLRIIVNSLEHLEYLA